MKIYNSANREKVVCTILKWFIGFVILYITIEVAEIAIALFGG